MANVVHLTKQAVEAIQPPDQGRAVYYDDEVRGLMVRVTASGTRTFAVASRVRSGDRRVVFATLGTFPNLTVPMARVKAKQALADLAGGTNPNETKKSEARSTVKFGGLADLYIEWMRRNGKRTADATRENFDRYLGTVPDAPPKKHGKKRTKAEGGVDWTKTSASTITVAMVKKLHRDLGEGVGHPTANRAVELVSAIYGRAKTEGWYVGENPALGVQPYAEVSRDRYLKGDEAPRFFAALAQEDPQWRDLLLLALLTGARRGNVQAMEWTDLDTHAGTWRVPGAVSKNGQPMVIPLTESALDLLAKRKNKSKFVFPSSESKSGHIESPKKAWARVLDRAKLTDLNPHDLRRTLGSWMVQSGATLAIVGGALGHKDQKSTAVYARLAVDPTRAAMELAQANLVTAATAKQPEPDAGAVKPKRKSRK